MVSLNFWIILCYNFSELEKEKAELYKEIEKWRERVEYEKQPNIAFEKENEEMRSKVS